MHDSGSMDTCVKTSWFLKLQQVTHSTLLADVCWIDSGVFYYISGAVSETGGHSKPTQEIVFPPSLKGEIFSPLIGNEEWGLMIT